MPILPAEPIQYPMGLWVTYDPSVDQENRWWCLHTMSRQEKALARHLHKHQLTHFLPQIVHESRTPSGRKIKSVIPMFRSYVFLFGDHQSRVSALKSNRVVSVLDASDQDGLENDLRRIHRVISLNLPLMKEEKYEVGTPVRIKTGPLQGFVGEVVRRNKRDYFQAIVRFLNQGVSMELQDWQVERIPDSDCENVPA